MKTERKTLEKRMRNTEMLINCGKRIEREENKQKLAELKKSCNKDINDLKKNINSQMPEIVKSQNIGIQLGLRFALDKIDEVFGK